MFDMTSTRASTLLIFLTLLLLTLTACSPSSQPHHHTTPTNSTTTHTITPQYKYLIFTPQCYSSLLLNFNITDFNCIKLTISKALGYGIVVGGSIVKVPQVIKILLVKSVYGISFTSVLAEASTNWVTIVYSWYRGNPFSIYGENVFILGQNVIIMALFVLFGRNVPKDAKPVSQNITTQYGVFLVIFLVGMFLAQDPLSWPKQIIDYCMFLQISLFSFARLTQIIHIFRCKSTGSLALLTCLLVFMGNLARLATVIIEIGNDYIFAFSVLLATMLNGFILGQFVMYRGNKEKLEGEKEGKKQK